MKFKFCIYDMKTKKELGVCRISSYELLDVKQPGKELCLVMENPDKVNYSFLVIQTLFIPSRKTLKAFEIVDDISEFVSAEPYLHFKYLLKQLEIDDYQYSIPIARYQPNDIQKLVVTPTYLLAGENELDENLSVMSSSSYRSPMLI